MTIQPFDGMQSWMRSDEGCGLSGGGVFLVLCVIGVLLYAGGGRIYKGRVSGQAKCVMFDLHVYGRPHCHPVPR